MQTVTVPNSPFKFYFSRPGPLYALLTCILILFMSGCGTLFVRSSHRPPETIYPATLLDLYLLESYWFKEPKGGFNFIDGAKIYTPMTLIDLPIATVTDTLFLPSDIYQSKRAKRERSFWQKVFEANKDISKKEEYKKHLGPVGKWVVSEKLRKDDYEGQISTELLAVLHEIGFSVASHKSLDEKLAKTIFKSYSSRGPSTLAGNPKTPVEILTVFANNDSIIGKEELVRNPSCPIDLLEQVIKKMKSRMSTLEAFGHERYKTELIIKLALRNLAEQQGTPIERLFELAKHPDSDIRITVARNINAPLDLLEQLRRDSDGQTALSASITLGKSSQAPLSLLKELSSNTDERIRASAADNLNLTEEILATLVNDKYPYVRKRAFVNLARRSDISTKRILDGFSKLAEYGDEREKILEDNSISEKNRTILTDYLKEEKQKKRLPY